MLNVWPALREKSWVGGGALAEPGSDEEDEEEGLVIRLANDWRATLKSNLFKVGVNMFKDLSVCVPRLDVVLSVQIGTVRMTHASPRSSNPIPI